MEFLTFDQLPQGGFAGLIERQFVKDRRVFTPLANSPVSDGIGNFVYLADANFLPNGETGMHGHREIDVISVMVDGQIAHAGSMAHGQDLAAGEVQVQRAGGEGFQHNEVNPNNSQNQMIQLWVLPEHPGKAADYKVYQPKSGELTQIYGNGSEPFDSQTQIFVANTQSKQNFSRSGPVMAYLSKGHGQINGQPINARTLVRSEDGLTFSANSDSQIIFITTGG